MKKSCIIKYIINKNTNNLHVQSVGQFTNSWYHGIYIYQVT